MVMFSASTKISLIAFLTAIGSPSTHAAEFEPRASSLTLPDILKNGTSQITSLTRKINSVIVYNDTLKADPSYVGSLLDQVGAAIDNTGAQINQIGKQPFDQISGSLTQSDIQYITTDYVTAVALSINAPQSIAGAYPEIQQGVNQLLQRRDPLRDYLCDLCPWLCPILWLSYASAAVTNLGSALIA
ncbi:hypothetical protein FRC04_006834 [Tulasnella sp. 424]|nr:hypothetical protein FRC04_006834 [Tulasnella sp. 424]KAG8960447.1 hypothetical protein FRC05_006843 [Tulasnella sp. 425]